MVLELERNVIRERVQAGVDRARKQGKQTGRPRVEVDPLQVAGLGANGYSWNEIARKLGVGRGTALNVLSRPFPKNPLPRRPPLR